jgi:hypothetical protein
MRKLTLFIVAIGIILSSSCRKDFSTIESYGNLEFSKDTVFLDTVFTNIGSSTYTLKVYNKHRNAISIPKIELENGSNSNYRLNVDGIPGKEFFDIDILGKDSIYIFIETTIDVKSVSDPLYTDRILFDTGVNQQDVDLVTLVKDAHFIYPNRDELSLKIDSLTLDGQPTSIQGRFLKDEELTFTKEKPVVIYGYAAVPKDKTLTIEAGSKVYFHNNSGLIVDKQATLIVEGTLSEKVTFEGDRLEANFSNIPGQWGTIWLRAGSKASKIKHAQIKNGVIGILIDSISDPTSPTLLLENTEIYNQANFGILARETHIDANNVVIGSAGQASLAATIGGKYNFTHCTFANFWNNGIRQFPAVLVNNFFSYLNESGQEVTETRPLVEAKFINCIFDGNNSIEFLIDVIDDGNITNYAIQNSMITFSDTNNTFEGVYEMDFNNNPSYENIILNGTSNFRNSQNEDFIIGQNSDAIGNGKSTPFTIDLLGISRVNNPDIGAYQHITFD